MWSIWLACLISFYEVKIAYDILLWSSFILLCMFNVFNVWYILARYKRKVEVQIEMHVKYCYSKGVMT